MKKENKKKQKRGGGKNVHNVSVVELFKYTQYHVINCIYACAI